MCMLARGVVLGSHVVSKKRPPTEEPMEADLNGEGKADRVTYLGPYKGRLSLRYSPDIFLTD